MKQRDLAKIIGIAESMVSQMLSTDKRKKKVPSWELAFKLEDVTGIPAKKWREGKVTKAMFAKATRKPVTRVDRNKNNRSNEI